MRFDRRSCVNRTLSVAGDLIMGSTASAPAPEDTAVHPVGADVSGRRQGWGKDEWGNVWYIAQAKDWPGHDRAPSVQPYLHLHGAEKMIRFAEAALRTEPLGGTKSPEGEILHATIRIGHATFEIDEAHGEFQPMPCYLHVYVPDADARYAEAIRAGATSVEAPATKPYGERSAIIKDTFGNTWFLATYLGDNISPG